MLLEDKYCFFIRSLGVKLVVVEESRYMEVGEKKEKTEARDNTLLLTRRRRQDKSRAGRSD